MVLVDLPFEILAVIVALALLLVYYASRQMFGGLIESIAGQLGPVGALLISGSTYMTTAIATAVFGWLEAGVTPVGRFLGGIISEADQLVIQAISTLNVIAGNVGVAVGGALTTAVQTAIDAVAASIAAVQNALSYSISAIGNQAISVAQTLYADTLGRIAALETLAMTGLADLEGRLVARLAGSEAAARGAIEAERARAEQRAREIEGESEAAVAEAERIAQEHADQVAAEARRAVEAMRADVDRRLSDLVTGLGGLGLTVSQLEPQIAGLLNKIPPDLITCLEELCHNVHPDVPNIQQSAALVESGLLLAYLAAAITHPDETAGVTVAVVATPIAIAFGALGGLVGIHQP